VVSISILKTIKGITTNAEPKTYRYGLIELGNIL